MATPSKFLPLYESAFARYQQGNGFLAGDVVKFKKSVLKSQWYLDKASTVQELIRSMMATEGNLRIGVLKNEYPRSSDAIGGNDTPASMADIYVELTPANWAYPMTVPLTVLERIVPTDNTIGGPVPKNIRDKDRLQIKGKEKAKGGGSAKETKVDDSNRQLATSNTKGFKGTKWDDSKVGGGNAKQSMPNSAMKESVALEDMYGYMLNEQAVPGSGQKQINEALSEVSEFDKADIKKEGNMTIVSFHDSVYSTVHGDEIPVVATVRLAETGTGIVVDTATAVDEHKRNIPLTPKDIEYLENRAVDFVGKQQPAELTEASSRQVTVGKHVVTHSSRTVGKEDPTVMVTLKFDNGYEIVEFFGDHELKDPSGKRIAFSHDRKGLDKSLHHLGLPPLADIYTAIENDEAATSDVDAETAAMNRLMGDPNP